MFGNEGEGLLHACISSYSNSQQLYSANSSRTADVLRSYIRKLRPRGEWLNGVGGCVVGGAEWV